MTNIECTVNFVLMSDSNWESWRQFILRVYKQLFEFNQKSLVVTKFVNHKYGVQGVCRHDSNIVTEIDKILKNIRMNQIIRKYFKHYISRVDYSMNQSLNFLLFTKSLIFRMETSQGKWVITFIRLEYYFSVYFSSNQWMRKVPKKNKIFLMRFA